MTSAEVVLMILRRSGSTKYVTKGRKIIVVRSAGNCFMFKYQVSEHMHVHTGIKKFGCGICYQRFTTKRSALKHRNNQHLRIYVTE